MLICPKCSHDNELGRMFCHKCGERLDLSRIKPPSAEEKKRRQFERGAKRTIRILVNVVVLGLLILVIALICATPVVPPVQSSNKDLVTSDAKRMELERLGKGQKTGQVVITEGQLNAFLSQRAFSGKAGGGLEVTPVALRLNLSDSRIKLEFLGTTHFGSYFAKDLYLGYEGQPTLSQGKFEFKPTAGWIGKLPIHPLLLRTTGFFKSRFGRLFEEFLAEKELLEKLTAIEVTPEAVTCIRSAAPAH